VAGNCSARRKPTTLFFFSHEEAPINIEDFYLKNFKFLLRIWVKIGACD
jgi:hypothetical protein